jgi:hypothetical protein
VTSLFGGRRDVSDARLGGAHVPRSWSPSRQRAVRSRTRDARSVVTPECAHRTPELQEEPTMHIRQGTGYGCRSGAMRREALGRWPSARDPGSST